MIVLIPEKMEAIFVYVTCKDKEEAMKIGRAMVESRQAACANILNSMESLYWWEGKVVSDSETVLVLKSMKEKLDALTESIKKIHSYTVPCVVAMEIVGGNNDYLNWLKEECQ